MIVHLSIRFIIDWSCGHTHVACFQHAARCAVQWNAPVEVEIDDFSSDRDGRRTSCEFCDPESWECLKNDHH